MDNQDPEELKKYILGVKNFGWLHDGAIKQFDVTF